jgi:DNA helicase-2/ATP-dependent DNA helicase PcrA
MKLDKTQEEIVKSKSNNIIVSAGAGSGKTRVLTERVKHLIESGVEPSNIVCITFTNKAANEMRERLSDVEGVGEAFIGTIHSFANNILKDSGKRYGILTADKETEIIRNLISKYAKHTTIDDYSNYIKWRNMEKLGIEDEFAVRPSESSLHEIGIFYGKISKPMSMQYPENLQDVCAKYNIITFDELITECTEYFKKTGGSIEYLLVDEFQDIGMNEYEFIMALNAKHNFMVGDDWQSIYGFKGGDVQIFLSLMQDDDWKSYHMATNYRNSTKILDVAKKVIKQASDIINKRVSAARSETCYVRFDSVHNLDEYFKSMRFRRDYKDWFILARTNKEIGELSKKLTEANIPFQTFKQGNTSTEELNKIMNSNTVKLLTVHASKGLENKNVIIYGNFKVQLPNYKRVNSEERKIFYVAITRAMDQLIILN